MVDDLSKPFWLPFMAEIIFETAQHNVILSSPPSSKELYEIKSWSWVNNSIL